MINRRKLNRNDKRLLRKSKAEALGLQRCDKYYYEGKFPKQDVEIIEEKEKIEL
ncbi:hypothetical protein [Agathobacter rectalis]|uniref:hypothetical protein n=1 Tax=Agathobacter rectalis TaxID=39491 RepID=UPI001313F990|nr:hypothetical protein [Agathobacter rectalis]